MNSRTHTEEAFKTVIETQLLNDGYAAIDRAGFDAEHAIFPAVVLDFIRETQPKEWGKLESLHGARTSEQVLTDLCKWMDKHGCLTTLRHGFKCYGRTLRVAFFKAAHGLNPGRKPLTPTSNLNGWNAGGASSRSALSEMKGALASQAQPCPVMTPASVCCRIDCQATDPLVEIRQGGPFCRNGGKGTSDGRSRRYAAKPQMNRSKGTGNRKCRTSNSFGSTRTSITLRSTT